MPITERGDWLAPAHLDQVTISVEHHRDEPGGRWSIRMTGLSRKRSHPLWTWTADDECQENVSHVVGGVLSAVAYYKPTDGDKFLRACAGGNLLDMEEMFPETK